MSAKKQWTTPEKLHMVESIKKSIHRSIQKINPMQYKNLLKGENIYVYLCYQGEIINSQYTKVALFMGATIYKKAMEKITAVVTNDSNNKTVKKLSAMGKPIVSVLWLQACFQQKRKVPYADFIFEKQQQEIIIDDQQSEEPNQTFENLLSHFDSKLSKFIQKTSLNTQQSNQTKKNQPIIWFLDKKQKLLQNHKQYIIAPHEIDLGVIKRKSQTISQKLNRKKHNNKKKVQIKSQTVQKKQQNDENQQQLRKTQQYLISESENQQINQDRNYVEQNRRSTNLIYEKYLKDFKEYENKYDKENLVVQEKGSYCQSQTPFFTVTSKQDLNNQKENQREYGNKNNDGNQMENQQRQTPEKNKNTDQAFTVFTKTCSVKKKIQNNKQIFGIANLNPNVFMARIQKINEQRQQEGLKILNIEARVRAHYIAIVSLSSKIQILRAYIQKPKMIISEKFIDFLQKNQSSEITNSFLKKFVVQIKIHSQHIKNKNIVLLDSVIGASFLEQIIKCLGGKIIKISDFLFNKKVDYVISNRKTFIKTHKQSYTIETQGKFLDGLLEVKI